MVVRARSLSAYTRLFYTTILSYILACVYYVCGGYDDARIMLMRAERRRRRRRVSSVSVISVTAATGAHNIYVRVCVHPVGCTRRLVGIIVFRFRKRVRFTSRYVSNRATYNVIDLCRPTRCAFVLNF